MSTTEGISGKVKVSVLSAIILGALAYFWQNHAQKVWNWVTQVSYGIWTWFISEHAMVGWLMVLVLALAVIGLIVIIDSVWPKSESSNWRNYKEDEFFGVRWRWGYPGDSIDNIAAYCPSCDTQIVACQKLGGYSMRSPVEETEYYCDHCGRKCHLFNGSHDDMLNKVHRQIAREIRTGAWTSRVSKDNAKK